MANKKVVKKKSLTRKIPKAMKAAMNRIGKEELFNENKRLKARLHENNKDIITYQNRFRAEQADTVEKLNMQDKNASQLETKISRLRNIVDSFQSIVDEAMCLSA